MNIDRRTVLKGLVGTAIAASVPAVTLPWLKDIATPVCNDSDTGFYQTASGKLQFVVNGKRIDGFPIMDASNYMRRDDI